MKVQFIKSHTHAGAIYRAGDVLDVPAHDAKWLAEHDVIQRGNKYTKPKVPPAADKP